MFNTFWHDKWKVREERQGVKLEDDNNDDDNNERDESLR